MKRTTLRLKHSMNCASCALALLFIPLALTCFALSPQARGQLSPPPDGCYSNFTTAEGCAALVSLTTGVANTGLGWRSLVFNSAGSFNTGVGGGALALNNADSNTAVGAAALLLNTTGTENVAVGTDALVFNDSGNFNNAIGVFALLNNTDGLGNNALGDHALSSNIHGNGNTAIGDLALENNDSFGVSTANFNTALGASALLGNTDGGSNNAFGYYALSGNTAGSDNQAMGAFALANNSTGSGNIAIGTLSGLNVTTANNVICIGHLLEGDNVDNSCYVGNIWGKAGGSQAVYVNESGKLGVQVSSRRFKQDIEPMEKASEVIYSLKPVSFRYKREIERTRPLGFGLVAEDVEKVNPDLVARDKEGRPYSVRYDQIYSMLLNEFLKEHKAFLDEQRTVEELKKQVAALTAGLQKVSAQLEVSKPSSQTVLNNH